jgi:hypothetical protein
MYVPPWLLAILVLVVVCAIGVTIKKSFHGLPENFEGDESRSPSEVPLPSVEPAEVAPSAQEIPVTLQDNQDALLSGNGFGLYLQKIKARVGNSATTPSQANLDLISGGPAAAPSEVLVEKYLPNQEKILPHQMPPTRTLLVTASTPTDAGTDAEKIQTNSTALRSLRENVRDEGKGSSDSFMNQYEVLYSHV